MGVQFVKLLGGGGGSNVQYIQGMTSGDISGQLVIDGATSTIYSNAAGSTVEYAPVKTSGDACGVLNIGGATSTIFCNAGGGGSKLFQYHNITTQFHDILTLYSGTDYYINIGAGASFPMNLISSAGGEEVGLNTGIAVLNNDTDLSFTWIIGNSYLSISAFKRYIVQFVSVITTAGSPPSLTCAWIIGEQNSGA